MLDETKSLIYLGAKAGGCARKLPAVDVLRLAPWTTSSAAEFMADVAVLDVEDRTLLQTIDFITPIVPDPRVFGRISAANALSDIYVAGGIPLVALAIACVPPAGEGEMAVALDEARATLLENGCSLIGGHSVVDTEAKLGFAVTGRPVSGHRLASGARPGDVVVLTKTLGVGVVTSGFRAGKASAEEMGQAVGNMIQVNDWVPRVLSSDLGPEIHGATDITGFGLLAHALELCRRSGVGMTIEVDSIPVMPAAVLLAKAGFHTSAYVGNVSYASDVLGADLLHIEAWQRIVLTDPQTSGGVLVSVAPAVAQSLIGWLAREGVQATAIGRVTASLGAVLS